MDIELIKLSKIKLNKDNPRFIKDDKYAKLKTSIEESPEFLKLRPVIVNEDMMILGGNMRYRAAKELKLKEIPVIIAKGLDEAKQAEFIIKDNVGFGEWDWDILANEWDTNQLIDWGMDIPEEWGDIEQLPDEEPFDGDQAFGAIEEPVTKLGDVWLLGKHRVMCGDSTEITAVEKLMNGEKSDMVFTDPPFDLDDHGYIETMLLYSKNAHIFLMHDDRGIVGYVKNMTLEFKQFFVGKFTFTCPRGNDPYLKHLLIAHHVNGEAIKHQNHMDGFSSVFTMLYRGSLKDDVTEHKHQKPIQFIADFILHYSEDGMCVFDIFLGSGSTLIACEKTNRVCYGMELEPKYCDVIIKRWQEYTGKEAILESTQETFNSMNKDAVSV